MVAQKGSLFLLKVGDGGGPETFTTVGGLRTTRFTVNNTPVDVTNKGSSGMRELLAGGGIQSMSVSGDGVFTDAATEETVRANAAANSINNYQIVSGNGDVWQGAFLITNYGRSGAHTAEETFTISLESSGAITFTAA
jgi:TP901-1 family phage major tail protein